ncbi:MAG: hypothetical protein K9G76_00245 [Bacteroidales bacterium]|nr:hypothetical protein [Bacteroidales bacterium]MCF8402541.1 hypothetical protein [Bacteroidales bacterium]
MKKIYGCLYPVLPKSIQSKLTRFLYKTGFKPTINRENRNFPTGKAVVVFSADMELAWATRYSKSATNPKESANRERQNIPLLLEQFDIYNIPVTWAIVGHLFLDACKKDSGRPHAHLPRPTYFENRHWRFANGDWYDHDPANNIQESPEWYGRDLVQLIKKSKTKHEIACHSFSHIDFSDAHCAPELARAELKECKDLALQEGIELRTMVFPGATAGNFDILKSEGFTNYRFETKYDIDLPQINGYGLVVIPNSFMIGNFPTGKSEQKTLGVLKKFIDKAIETKKLVHFYFHPSLETWIVKVIFPSILKYIYDKRKAGLLDVLTMNSVSEIVLKHETR